MADRASPNDGESTVARWSRRKHETQEIVEAPDASESEETLASPNEDSESEGQDDVVAALPPIGGLTAESDFTPFLDRAVPAELRKLALRKLWLSDPVFGHLDGLNDYDDDFRTLGVGKLVRTAYQVGKGMVTRAEQAAENATNPSPANESAAATDDTGQETASAETGVEKDESDPPIEA